MTIIYHDAVLQGSDEWRALRCGVITASVISQVITPKLKPKKFDCYALLAERITGYVEPEYISNDMLRGQLEEREARALFEQCSGKKVREIGFITNDDLGFVIGCSPDGLIDDNGLLECKSRKQKIQLHTIINGIPKADLLQVQMQLFVSQRDYCDYVSYCGGLPLHIEKVYLLDAYESAIRLALLDAETNFKMMFEKYQCRTVGMMPTERLDEKDMIL
jgi:predicted phage-related endonuclease